jgi:prepilin-type N-terminal cleavage/methylation domain-containing protein
VNGRQQNAGFSLVEIMCAIIILGIALVGLTQGTTTALSSNKESELQTTAALLAAGKIEMLRAEGYLTEGVTEGEGGEGLSLYRWKRTLTGTGIDGLFDVSVVVENSKTGAAIYELQTLLFDPPSYSSSDTAKDRKDSLRSRRRERSR